MIDIKLDEHAGVAVIQLRDKLSEDDFKQAAMTIDPYIEKTGKLNGVILYSKDFPGWDSFSGFIKHMKFIRDHHKKLDRVALVTDSKLVNAGERIVKHFVSAEVRKFSFDQLEAAKEWVSALAMVE